MSIKALLLLAAALAQTAEIERDVRELSRISGMKARKPLAAQSITREQVNEFLKKRIKEVAKPEEIRAEEAVLKKFGLAPPDFDLAKSTVALLTEQAAAFYDYDSKKLYLTDWTPSEMRDAALVHEIAHALADQNYNLGRFVKGAQHSDDASLARLAVVEGQATWLMSEYLAGKMGQSLKESPGLVQTMARATERGAGEFPEFDKAPLYFRETLVFPYTKGMLFQNAVVEKSGQEAFGEVFRRPPVSTQEILHPEVYLAGRKPTSPPLPRYKPGRGYKTLIGGSIGELDHAVLLRQYTTEEDAQRAAPAWRGGAYALLENRREHRSVLLYASEWESEEAARDFFQLYRQVLQKKWREMRVDSEAPDAVSGTGDDGRFTLRRTGAVVTSIEGALR